MGFPAFLMIRDDVLKFTKQKKKKKKKNGTFLTLGSLSKAVDHV